MSNYIIQGETLMGIADAIREKTGSTDQLTPAAMASAIAGIQAGGGSGSGGSSVVTEKDVNFYDYDGTLLYSYTVEEAQALAELPAGPEHEGLVFQKWNWSLANVKALTRPMNIGALYNTDDGSTRIHIHLEEGYTSPMLGIGVNGTVTVDWGDGTEPDTLRNNDTYYATYTNKHEYAAPGDYLIKLIPNGSMKFTMSENAQTSTILINAQDDTDPLNKIYLSSVRKIELGDGFEESGFTWLSFGGCHSLETISVCANVYPTDQSITNCWGLKFFVVPNSDNFDTIGQYAFRNCYSLTGISLPDNVKEISSNAFSNCYSLRTITLPDSLMTFGTTALGYCYHLLSVVLPNSITNTNSSLFTNSIGLVCAKFNSGISTIGAGAFKSCISLRSVDFTQCTKVPTLSNTSAFSGVPNYFRIMVPAALYDEWIAANNWSSYAANIVAV